MDNNEAKKTTPADGNGTAPGAKHSRNRHHHRSHNHNKENQQNRAGQTAPETEGKTPDAEQKKNPAERPENRGGERNGHRHDRRRDRRRGDRPEKEAGERELAEWRAKIVLNASDQAVAPTLSPAPAAPSSPFAEIRDEEPAREIDPSEIDPSVLESAPALPDDNGEKVEIVGVRFRDTGKEYYFDPKKLVIHAGDRVVVETSKGPEFGEVSVGNKMVPVRETTRPLRPVLRIATEEDVARDAENRAKEKEAFAVCQQKIADHKLEMKLVDVQYSFDNTKLLFYFTADGRVDFRDLVKDLASVFRTRIELRQIGIRDEAKMLGGLGACGRPLCCSTFLPDFAQVSIKMAKEQNLSLNSTKISGVCGRLMCCLRFENDVYAEEIRKTPSNDTLVRTADGIGTVIGSNPLAGTIRVILKDGNDTTPKQYHRDDVVVLGKSHGGERKDAPSDAKTAPAESEKQ